VQGLPAHSTRRFLPTHVAARLAPWRCAGESGQLDHRRRAPDAAAGFEARTVCRRRVRRCHVCGPCVLLASTDTAGVRLHLRQEQKSPFPVAQGPACWSRKPVRRPREPATDESGESTQLAPATAGERSALSWSWWRCFSHLRLASATNVTHRTRSSAVNLTWPRCNSRNTLLSTWDFLAAAPTLAASGWRWQQPKWCERQWRDSCSRAVQRPCWWHLAQNEPRLLWEEFWIHERSQTAQCAHHAVCECEVPEQCQQHGLWTPRWSK